MGKNVNSEAFAFRLPLEYAEALRKIATERDMRVSPMIAPMIMRRIDEIKEEEGWD